MNWKQKQLSDVIDIIGGGTPKTSVSEYWDGDIPWLSVKDFNDNHRTVFYTEKTITQKGLINSSTKILNKGDLIISARGTVGAIAQLGRDMAFNQSCYGLRAKENSDNTFIYYLLKQELKQIQSKTHGSVFDTITRETFDTLKVLLPPLPEQRAIAEILSSIDDKIELNNQMNRTLESMAQAIFKQWFVDFEFPTSSTLPLSKGETSRSDRGGGKMIDSELGPIPEGWRVGVLGDIIDNYDSKRIPLSKNEREKMKGPYPYYGAASLMDYVNDFIFDGVFLLMGEDGTVMTDDGKPVLQYVWGKFWVNNHAHVMQGKNPFTTEYIYLLLKNMDISHIVTGAVQAKINQKNMNDLKVLIPHEMILTQFNDLILPLFSKRKLIYEESQTLSTLRDSLLPKLMSGELRVPEVIVKRYEEPVSEA